MMVRLHILYDLVCVCVYVCTPFFCECVGSHWSQYESTEYHSSLLQFVELFSSKNNAVCECVCIVYINLVFPLHFWPCLAVGFFWGVG